MTITIKSDDCTFQNWNEVLTNALLNLSMLYCIIITQKFFEQGHSQIEVVSVHSCIERKIKNRKICLPSDLLRTTEEKRLKRTPYKYLQLKYTLFDNYYLEAIISPGKITSDLQVSDIKDINYSSVETDINKLWLILPCGIKRMAQIIQKCTGKN